MDDHYEDYETINMHTIEYMLQMNQLKQAHSNTLYYTYTYSII